MGIAVITEKKETERDRFEQKLLAISNEVVGNDHKAKGGTKSPDQPDMAAFQNYLMTFDPATGEIPKERLVQAYEEFRKMQFAQQSEKGRDNLLEWETSGSDMGGRTRAIMFDPNDPENKKVWAGGVTGGLWYVNDITNTNENWTAVGDFWSNLSISCMTYDPNNTQTMYLGTGEAQTARIIYRASSGVGNGIYVTYDAGETWEQLESTSEFQYITDIAVRDENGTSVIYACVVSGTYEGEDHISQPSNGLYRSDNGGDTWSQVLPQIANSSSGKPYSPADIELTSDGKIFIGTMENLDLEGGATILYSQTGFSGSWSVYSDYNTIISNEPVDNIPARTLLASSPSNPDIVYAQFAAGYTGQNFFKYYKGKYMVKSEDGGSSWTNLDIPDEDWSTLAWHAFVLKVDPEDPNSVFTGGLDLWKTTNGGENWNHISDWIGMYYGGGDDYVHADQHAIVFQPENPSTALFTSDGGVFLSNTADYSYPVFIERNQGYGTLQFYTCAIKPLQNGNQYIGGLQDNGTLYHSGNPLNINNMIDGGDGAYCFWDQDQFQIFITSVYYNNYTAWNNNIQADYFGGNSGTFISPADYDDANNILYSNAVSFIGGNANKLLRAKNIPNNINETFITLGTGSNVPFSHIKSSPYAPVGASTLFVGTESGKLFKVTTAESTPNTEEIGTTDFPMANLSCVAIGNSEDELLVTFSNYGVSSVWLTMDGGETWTEKETNLPDMPIRWAIFHPENNGQALLATEIGVWSTNTLQEENTVWEPDVDGMANVRVDMLRLRESDNVVLAATHGRGLFTSEYPLNIYTGINEQHESEFVFTVFPNPAKDRIQISGIDESADLRLSIYNISGQKIIDTKVTSNNQFIDISYLSSGTYILVAEGNNVKEKQKLIVE